MIRFAQTNHRHAAALAVALLVLVIAAALAIGLTRLLVARQRVQAAHQRHVQVVELARAGVDRGVAQVTRSADYEGETWTVAADQIASDVDVTVEIFVRPVGDSETLQEVSARAAWGEGEHRTQHTRSLMIERDILVEE